MAIKKSELHSSLLASCDELRGEMDASQYKDYVLFMLFIKYISDKYGNSDDFAPPVTIPKGASFTDMVKLKGKSDIGDKINTQIIQPLIDNNSCLAPSDFPDFNDPSKLGEGKAMVDRLSNLIDAFQQPEFDFITTQNDAGAVFEDLIKYFANENGRGISLPCIPSEINQLMVEVLGISESELSNVISVYDPMCGYGSLLLQSAENAGGNVQLYGQEPNHTIHAQACMNMILHDIPSANIAKGNSLTNPAFFDGNSLQQFDYVVGCPPFSLKHWDTGLSRGNDRFSRFVHGIPPKSKGDFAYIQHMLASLKSDGRMVALISHGTLFRTGAEAAIRQSIIEADLVEAIIGLPANLLSHTGIPSCLLICSKQKSKDRAQKVLFINADRQFSKARTRNVLLPEHTEKIVQAFLAYSDIEQFSRVVSLEEIRSNEFNLNLPRYVDTSELAVLLKQYCSQFQKCQIEDLAAEINTTSGEKAFTDQNNAIYIPRFVGHMRPPVTELSELPPGKHQHYFQVVLNDKALNHYVAQFLSSTIGRHALSALAQGSATQLINRASLAEVLIVLPSLSDQAANIQTHQRLIVLKETIEKISLDLSLRPTASREIDDLLDSMLSVIGKLSIGDQIRSLIRQGESKTVEFKETYSLCLRSKQKKNYVEESALKTIVAFLNSEGGTLLIGVSDELQIVGIERELKMFHKNNSDNFLKHLKNKLKSRIGEPFYPFIDYSIAEVDGAKVVHCECKQSDAPCFLDGAGFYVRTNPATDKLEGQKQYEYMKNHFKNL